MATCSSRRGCRPRTTKVWVLQRGGKARHITSPSHSLAHDAHLSSHKQTRMRHEDAVQRHKQGTLTSHTTKTGAARQELGVGPSPNASTQPTNTLSMTQLVPHPFMLPLPTAGGVHTHLGNTAGTAVGWSLAQPDNPRGQRSACAPRAGKQTDTCHPETRHQTQEEISGRLKVIQQILGPFHSLVCPAVRNAPEAAPAENAEHSHNAPKRKNILAAGQKNASSSRVVRCCLCNAARCWQDATCFQHTG